MKPSILLLMCGCLIGEFAGPVRAEAQPHLTASGGIAGTGNYIPGQWATVPVAVANPGDEPADVLVTTYFAGDSNLQYGRRLWVPARSQRTSWYPVRVPESLPDDGQAAGIRTLLLDRSGSAEVLIESETGRRLHEGLLPVHRGRIVTGMISDGRTKPHTRAAVAALRLSGNQSPRVSMLHDEFLPATPESLDALTEVVLAGDRPASDEAGLTALRRWLHGGGHLWIMLDQTAPRTVERLLGDAFACHVVDRVGLTEVLVEPQASGLLPGIERNAGRRSPRRFEQPVELVRVALSEEMTVTHRVGGWPAAFWRDVGRGRVLVTTLGPRAWIRPRRPEDPDPPGAGGSSFTKVARQSLEQLAPGFLNPRRRPHFEPAEFEPYLREQIGYRIAGRGAVAAILGLFCLTIAAAGVVLARRGALERLGWISPAAALVAAGVLGGLGAASRQSAPPTVAVAQRVDVVPGTRDVQADGLLALYNLRETAVPLGAERGGTFRLDMRGREGTLRRMVWTDLDRWHWESPASEQGLRLPPGVRTAEFQTAGRIDEPVVARATFGPSGLQGRLEPGPFDNVGDAVVATSETHRIAVRVDREGGFTAGPGDVLPPGEFVTGLLGDEQRRRQAVYRKLLPAGRPTPYTEYARSARPTLLFWSDPLETGFVVPEERRHAGAAVVAVPLQLDAPPRGARVRIPAPFLISRAVPGPAEYSGSLQTYNHRTGEWLTRRRASWTWLRFQVPVELLPLDVEQAALAVKIKAPLRPLDVVAPGEEGSIPLGRADSPIGTLRFAIEEAEALRLDAEGGFVVGLHVGESERAGETLSSVERDRWKIDHVALEVVGRVAEPQAEHAE